MFDAPELTPDAEWLLLSGKGQVDTLAFTLVDTYYPFLKEMACTLLYPSGKSGLAGAEHIIRSSLTAAIREAYRYRAETGVQPWLAGFLVAACREYLDVHPLSGEVSWSAASPQAQAAGVVLGSLGLEQLALVALHFRFRWPFSEIERVPGMGAFAQDLAGEIDRILDVTVLALAGTGLPADHSEAALALVEAFQAGCSPTGLSHQELQKTAMDVAGQARRSAARQRQRYYMKEMLALGLVMLAIVGTLWGANRFLPPEPIPTPLQVDRAPLPTPPWLQNVSYVVQPGDTVEKIAGLSGMTAAELRRLNGLEPTESLQAGQPLWVAVPGIAEPAPSPTPFASSSPPLPTMMVDPSPLDVYRLASDSQQRWYTLWADFQMVSYPPAGARLSPRAYRFQAWVSQPGLSLEIFNELGDSPLFRHIIRDGRYYPSVIGYSQSRLAPDWQQPGGVLLQSPLLREMIFPAYWERLKQVGNWQILSQEMIAERPVVSVELSAGGGEPLARFWMDIERGVLLRRQLFDKAGSIQSDMVATHIYFNVEIPAELFDPRQPWEGGFAEEDWMEPEPINPALPAPTWALPSVP